LADRLPGRPGADKKWGFSLPGTEQGPDIKHDVKSVTKSVVSLLAGIALDRKLIPDLDRPVKAFGLGGQRIAILSELDTVIVFTTGRYEIVDGWKVTIPLIDDFILPATVPQ
jgi:CubicO group peptidase (beta-lactamase class C family)